ncbi:MAG: hypothetical protein HKN35_00125 [Woeseia sp.]|nr:hypothetical protein [Woeseia sp.]
MSESDNSKTVGRCLLTAVFASYVGFANAGTSSVVSSIDGSDLLSINGSDARSINGSDARSIDGSDLLSINGSDLLSINGSDARSIDGSDARSIDGSDLLSINGSDLLSINGSDARSVNGSDARSIDRNELLALGRVDYIGDGFISVLGQTVLGSLGDFSGIDVDATVALYGSMDSSTGAFAGARIELIAPAGIDAGMPSFLQGVVDSVDAAMGRAVVNGVTVDYTALLSDGAAPQLGDEFALSGRSYRGLGLLVAEPDLRVRGGFGRK